MSLVRAAAVLVTAAILTGCVVRTPAARGTYHCHNGIPRVCHNAVHR